MHIWNPSRTRTLAFAVLALGTGALLSQAHAREKAQARDIVIAQVAPFTGSQAPSGKSIHAGIKLYIDHINATGGINGAKIRLVAKDDGYKPEDTVRLVKELIASEKPVAFIATVGTANLVALNKDGVLAKANIPMVGGVSGGSALVGAPNIFITKATYHDEVAKLFEIVSMIGLNRIGIVYQDDAYGKDILTGAEKAAVKTKMQIVVKAPYERNTTNVAAAVDVVIKADPPLIYLGAITTPAIEFIKQYRARGGAAQIYGVSVIDPSAMIAKLGPQVARGYAFGTLVPPTSARVFAIVREYQELAAKAKNPDLAERSMEGFVSAKLLVHALRKAGNPSSSAGVIKVISSTSQLDLGDYFLDFTRKEYTGSRFVDFAILGNQGRVIR